MPEAKRRSIGAAERSLTDDQIFMRERLTALWRYLDVLRKYERKLLNQFVKDSVHAAEPQPAGKARTPAKPQSARKTKTRKAA